jgi:hypothetical protein
MGYANLWSVRMMSVYHIENVEAVLKAVKEWSEADAEQTKYTYVFMFHRQIVG